MTTIQGLVINDSGFIEKVAHSGSVTPTSFTGQSPKVRWDESEPDVIMNLNVDTTRASTLPTRSSRSRISNKRSRPYRDTASRPNSNQRTAPCRFFQAGKCTAGDSCRYRHVGRSTSPESDLDQQLQAFVNGDDDNSPALSKSTSKITYNPDDFPDDEELYEVVPNPSSTISEVRFNTRSNPGEIRTYFVVQRQTVVEYEGNNVGILSGGVLLGVPHSNSSVARAKVEESPEDVSESEMASSPTSSLVSNDSDHEQWKGPVSFENSASTEAESLIWADDDGDVIPMEMANSELNTYSMVSIPELPSPPPIIRRIIRQVDSHNRRHSLS